MAPSASSITAYCTTRAKMRKTAKALSRFLSFKLLRLVVNTSYSSIPRISSVALKVGAKPTVPTTPFLSDLRVPLEGIIQLRRSTVLPGHRYVVPSQIIPALTSGIPDCGSVWLTVYNIADYSWSQFRYCFGALQWPLPIIRSRCQGLKSQAVGLYLICYAKAVQLVISNNFLGSWHTQRPDCIMQVH